ncbi:MAG: heparinase II/III family protein, partial [Promethearchaeota archaeon]
MFNRQINRIDKTLNYSIEFTEFLKRGKRLLAFKDNEKLLFEVYDKNDELVHPYFFQIEQMIEAYEKSKDTELFSSIWIDKNFQQELSNNNHRFHQFSNKLSGYNDDIIIDLITNWISKNSPSNGNAWNSFNCTLRILNWLRMLLLLNTKSFNDEGRWEKIERSMFVQVKYISKNIEYHIPGNHVAIQYYVLWLFSNIFPEWKNVIDELKNSERLFVTEFINEYLESGLHFEQSFHYHIQITLIGLYYVYSKQNLNEKIDEEYLNTLRKATEVVDSLISKDQYIPMLSDNCFTFFHKNLSEDLSNISYLSQDLIEQSDVSEKANPITDLKNQYVIAILEESNLIFDVGNIGVAFNPGHGHSDLLSFIYGYNKYPIFIDAGTRKYSPLQE